MTAIKENKQSLAKQLICELSKKHSLEEEQYAFLIENRDPKLAEYAAYEAVNLRKQIYGDMIFIRGLIEISNFCKNDCLYCGIRRSNQDCNRYRLNKELILSCCHEGYALGFRTFVLQGGEDSYYSDETLCDIIRSIKTNFPDCAVTLSLGERSFQSYESLFNAGADRYLLRHETADKEHYNKLHPAQMSFENRMNCLDNLKKIGFQTGCGFMVGSPFQTVETLAKDLKFIESFKPHMCGIGPFIPHHATPFRDEAAGSMELTLYLLSLVRLILPKVLLPSTTALGTIDQTGREKGILAGANVVMPNLSPISSRKKYELYDNKICTDEESAQSLAKLKLHMKSIGYEIVVARGDARE